VKIAITDACIFIDVYDLQLIPHLFRLELEIHTSVDVFNELYPAQQAVLKIFQSVGKLTIHNLLAADRLAIYNARYPNALSNSDKTVLYLADQLQAILLSSDKAVRHNAKLRAVPYHGMLWIFDKLVDASLISYHDACEKLQTLIATNIIYQNNAVLIAEMNNRLKKWRKCL
jgi:hypothetical protein